MEFHRPGRSADIDGWPKPARIVIFVGDGECMMRKTYGGMIAFLVLIAVAEGAKEWTTTSVEEMELAWAVEDGELLLRVSAPTAGWVAVGFEPSRAMADANILIGFVDGSDVTVEDHFGNGMFSHREDLSLGGTADVTVIAGTESDGRTELEFSIPLDSGDEFDRVLEEGRLTKVILAWGSNDNVGRKHRMRHSTEITL
ncbi:MAG: DOMON domain-containing protein [Spirochaetales bacterium]|nr:MAG: DOMON domain-containing protein [Spirochaetales bacterium]